MTAFFHPRSIALASLAVLAVTASVPSFAGIGPCGVTCSLPTLTGGTVEGDKRETRIFGGVNWVFGSGPELVVGVRSVRTDADKATSGARFEATFPFSASSISFDKLRLRVVNGQRSSLAELGMGYTFQKKDWLVSGAWQGNHVVLGADFTLTGKQWQPWVGVNTLGRPHLPQSSGGTLSCANGWQLVDVTTLNNIIQNDSSYVLNGYTCQQIPS
jgi:hypothetical protein